MSLLQIAEPNQSVVPHQQRYALGIDLGTTRSMVAVVRSGKAAVIAADDTNDTLLPSVVYYGNGNKRSNNEQAKNETSSNIKSSAPLVGQQALNQVHNDPANTIISAKRFMGRSMADIRFSHPYTLKGEGSDMPVFITDQGDKSPVTVSADILRTLEQRAKQALPIDSIAGAVITVPAYFDDAQRQATKDAAKVAGINVLRLINEPTAAAVAYGLDAADFDAHNQKDADNQRSPTKAEVTNPTKRLFLIYDLGGGTFDVSILRMSAGIFEVLSTGGNSALGGDDIDRLLMAWLLKQAEIAPNEVSLADKTRLTQHAKHYKHQLSETNDVNVEVSLNGKSWQGQLTQVQFSQIIEPVTRRTLNVCEQVLRDAKVTKTDLNKIILVGGSTRMPIIKRVVTEFFEKDPLCHLNPDEVVALGAAQAAQQLISADKSNNTLLLDVTPLSLGLETMGGLVEVLIPRNTPIPVSKRQIFTTHQDGQTGIVIHVVQGERETVENCRSLGRFELYGIPPMKAGFARIEVTFTIDTDGQLSVSAEEPTTHTKHSIDIKPTYGLSETQQEQLLQAGFEHAQEDKLARKLIETEVEAERELVALDSALIDFGTLLTDSERQALKTAMLNLRQLLDSVNKLNESRSYDDTVEHITTAQATLKPLSDDFASRIMNQSVSESLAGTTTDDWS